MFDFLRDVSVSYREYFAVELQALTKRMGTSVSQLGPAIVIWHQTFNTDPGNADPVGEIRSRYGEEDVLSAFCGVGYVGQQRTTEPTDFQPLRLRVLQSIDDQSVRAHRSVQAVHSQLCALQAKFGSDIPKPDIMTFPDEFFTCRSTCLACGNRCNLTTNHEIDGTKHTSPARCCHSVFNNVEYYCEKCHEQGGDPVPLELKSASEQEKQSESALMIFAKRAYRGDVWECPLHGVVHSTRATWYYDDKEREKLRKEYVHIWEVPDDSAGIHVARQVVDSATSVVRNVGEMAASASVVPASLIKSAIRPVGWQPDEEITHCGVESCHYEFKRKDSKHHCRRCGKGVCGTCSKQRRPLPDQGWGSKVRVCDVCVDIIDGKTPEQPHAVALVAPPPPQEPNFLRQLTDTMVRNNVPFRAGEVTGFMAGVVGAAAAAPVQVMQRYAAPSYWKTEDDVDQCHECEERFDPERGRTKHHCRRCGEVVCADCSGDRKAVPKRAWLYPVRVCKSCNTALENEMAQEEARAELRRERERQE